MGQDRSTKLRDLNSTIAEKVMGWKRGANFDDDRLSKYWIEESPGWRTPHLLPAFSTSIQDAWWIIEKLHGKPHWLIPSVHWLDLNNCWQAHFYGWDDTIKDSRGWEAEAETAPLAICLAALKVVGVETPGDEQP